MTFTLDAASIMSLAVNQSVTREFPFLKGYAAGKKKGCCGDVQPTRDSRRVLQAIASLPPDRISRLKQLLGADAVVITTVRVGRTMKVRL